MLIRLQSLIFVFGLFSPAALFSEAFTNNTGSVLLSGKTYGDIVQISQAFYYQPDNTDFLDSDLILQLRVKNLDPTKDFYWHLDSQSGRIPFAKKMSQLELAIQPRVLFQGSEGDRDIFLIRFPHYETIRKRYLNLEVVMNRQAYRAEEILVGTDPRFPNNTGTSFLVSKTSDGDTLRVENAYFFRHSQGVDLIVDISVKDIHRDQIYFLEDPLSKGRLRFLDEKNNLFEYSTASSLGKNRRGDRSLVRLRARNLSSDQFFMGPFVVGVAMPGYTEPGAHFHDFQGIFYRVEGQILAPQGEVLCDSNIRAVSLAQPVLPKIEH